VNYGQQFTFLFGCFNFQELPPPFPDFTLNLEQIEWAKRGVLMNCQICFLVLKFIIFFRASQFFENRHPDFRSCLSIGSRSNGPNGGDKAKKRNKAKKDVCIARKFNHDSFGWFCRFRCSTLINHDNYVSTKVIFD